MNSFNTAKYEVQQLLNKISKTVEDDLRLEAIVESIKDWSEIESIASIEQWFIEQQEQCSMVLEDIPITECRGWSLNPKSGFVEHDSGEFFYVQGIRIKHSKSREVTEGWDQPMLTQVGYNGGIVGVIRTKINEIPYYLVQAKAEPGNPDKVQISPALQATFSNIKKSHGGSNPLFHEYFEFPDQNNATVLFNQWMSEDGGRLHLKCNRGMIVEILSEAITSLEIPPSFKWLSLFQIKHLIKNSSWVNPHVRGIISHL